MVYVHKLQEMSDVKKDHDIINLKIMRYQNGPEKKQ